MVVYGPYSFGQSFHRQPTFMTWMIPLMTSRLRRGFTPRRFFGIACSIASSCSSASQNKLDIGALPHMGASNRSRRSHVKWKLGSEPSRTAVSDVGSTDPYLGDVMSGLDEWTRRRGANGI